MSSASPDADSTTFVSLIWATTAVELPIEIVLIPSAVLNIVVVAQTTLHPNFKFVLLTQSTAIMLIACVRLVIIATMFTTHDPFTYGALPIQLFATFIYEFMNFIGHVLFVERAIATVFVRRYETHVGVVFSAVWFTLLFVGCAYMTFIQSFVVGDRNYSATSVLILLFNYINFALVFLEVFAAALIVAHNRDRYIAGSNVVAAPKHSTTKSQSQTLSERYQITENIRTGRQLTLTYVMHVVNMFSISAAFSCMFFHPFTESIANSLALNISAVTISCANLTILISVILHHPMLRQKAAHFINTTLCRQNAFVCWKKKVHPLQKPHQLPPPPLSSHQSSKQRSLPSATPIRGIDGAPLVIEYDTVTHFRVLRDAWKTTENE